MLLNYLNFEFWFYQIYLLFHSVYSLIISGTDPQAGTTVASAIALVLTAAYALVSFGVFLAALYVYSTIWLYVLLFFLLFALISYFLIQTVGILLTIAILFLCWLIYSLYKTAKLRKKEEEQFLSTFAVASDPKTEEVEEWQDIIDHVDSDNEAQWKLALIDADKILENLLRENGYDGDGVGGRLKAAELQGGLKSLQDAWEAHKIRNRIAHEAGFVLTKREARRAVELYKKVFEQLGFL